MLVCVSVEAVAVAEVAEVKDNILESSLKKKIKKCDSSKSIQRALGGGGGQRGGIFMKAIFPSAEQDQNGQSLS